jgi:hypothetical protein
MPLNTIEWNTLYDSSPEKRAFAEERIQRHYDLKGLGLVGVETASVR